MDVQVEEMHRARHVGGGMVLPCPPLGVTFSQHVPVLTILEALRTPYCRDFYGDFR